MNQEIRIGDLKEDLGTAVRKYDSRAMSMLIGDLEVEKYVSVKYYGPEKYFLVASTAERGSKDYNFMLTVMGEKESRITKILSEFEEKTGIELRDAPARLQRIQQNIINYLNRSNN